MADNPDRLTDISDEEIERLYNYFRRGLERRLARVSRRFVEPIDNDEPTPNVSN